MWLDGYHTQKDRRMKIKILEIIFKASSYCDVLFSSEFGVTTGRWGALDPKINGEYHVELTIGEPMEWGKNAFKSTDNRECLETQDGKPLLCGRLENIESD